MRKHLVRIGVAAIVPLSIGGVLALLWGGRLVPSALAAIEGPTLTGPASRSTVSSYSPTLTWTNPPGAAHYQVQVIPPPQVWYVM
ncbi:MAG: hypothetical protein NTZ05_09620, partial [Chloroflexi bacterium]|nr:hypothetical protein [Chloroflexota bacterium]